MVLTARARKILLVLAALQFFLPAYFYLRRTYGTMTAVVSPIPLLAEYIQTTSPDNDTYPDTPYFYHRGGFVDVQNVSMPALRIPPISDRDEVGCVKLFKKQFGSYCERLTETLENITANTGLAAPRTLDHCACFPAGLKGRQSVALKFNESWEDAEARLEGLGVRAGGQGSPRGCTARQRVAVIIPFRDRQHHLQVLLRHLHPLLQRQQLEYTIFVVEQREPKLIFNKGMLMNAGFREVERRYGPFDCYIFNDVDMIPEDDRNIYTCHNTPRHMGAYISKFKYTMCCGGIFGGATSFSAHQFIKVNGFSNEFYGWGGEDDDMLRRIKSQKLQIVRYPRCVSRYTMIPHQQDKRNPRNPKRWRAAKMRPDHYRHVGLSSLTYEVVDQRRLALYTWILCDLPANITLPDKSVVPVYKKTSSGTVIS